LAKKGEELLTNAKEGATTLLRKDVPNIKFFRIPLNKDMVFEKVLKATPAFTPNNSGILMGFCQGKWTIKKELL
jgi:hypothetical protein